MVGLWKRAMLFFGGIGIVMMQIAYAIAYFAIFGQIFVLSRLVGKHFIELKPKNHDSYWKKTNTKMRSGDVHTGDKLL